MLKEKKLKSDEHKDVAPKTFKNFLISGSGRSGTKFLANLMNKSEVWSVKHEPPPAGIENYTSSESIWQTYKRFELDHYGEVNSYLRKILIHFPVNKKGLLMPVGNLKIVGSEALYSEDISVCILGLNPENQPAVMKNNIKFAEQGGIFTTIFPSSEIDIERVL